MKLRRTAIYLLWAVGAARGDDQKTIAAGQGCLNDAALYDGKYTLSEDAELDGLAFLRPIRQMMDAGGNASLRRGATFSVTGLTAVMSDLQNKLSANADDRVHVSVLYLTFERCTPSEGPAGELHVSLTVFDSSPSLGALRLFESRQKEAMDPVGVLRPGVPELPIKFAPRAGFNSSDHLFGGGRLSVKIPAGPIRSITAEGTASHAGANGDLDLTGGRTWDEGWLQSAAWHFGYQRTDRPTGTFSLTGSAVYGALVLTSKPLGASNTVVRFGSELSGGNSQSDLKQSSLPADTMASATDQTWKNAAGFSSRWGSNAIAASYGIQLGRANRGRALDYYKQLVDVEYSTYRVFRGHKLLEYDSRFSAGSLKTPGLVPAAERFFGGNRETFLFSGPEFENDWRIRANPFLRGVPANQFSRVTPGAMTGGEGFIAWNNTVALPLPLVNYPLLPDRVEEDPHFQNGLARARKENRSFLTVSYTADDPSYKESVKKIPAVDGTLAELRTIMEEVAATGGPGAADAKACSTSIRDKRALLEVSADAMDSVAKEDFEGAVIPTVRQCVGKVQAEQPDARIPPLISRLNDVGTEVNGLLAKVNTEKVSKLVNRDLDLATRVMDVFFKEASIVTVNPVVVFDVARLAGPVNGDRLGLRYSVGGGLRMQLFRTVSVTSGYAANPRRGAGEKAGAVFFSLELLDLFR